MSELTEQERIAQLARTCACINLRRASRAITHYYDTLLLAAAGLRATQITPLVVLYLAGPQTVQEIAGKLMLDRTTLTRNLKLLEDGGLIRIEPGRDQRTRKVTLTKQGASALLKALPAWEEAQSHIEQGVGEADFQTLLTQLSHIAELTREV
jgi:DNA-binding MarR family transcriptional regulator